MEQNGSEGCKSRQYTKIHATWFIHIPSPCFTDDFIISGFYRKHYTMKGIYMHDIAIACKYYRPNIAISNNSNNTYLNYFTIIDSY